MRFSFKFSNLLGSIYRKGNLLFTNDGNSVISPVGNRLTIYDLKNNKSQTLPIESYYNFTTLALSPNGSLLIAVNEVGEALLISMISQSVIHRYNFKHLILNIKFSPDGRYFAVCKSNRLFVFSAPGKCCGMFNPFILQKIFTGHYDDSTCIDWTTDSRVLAVGSKDTTVKIFGMPKMKNFRVCTLSAHADNILGTFFETNSLDVISVSANGRICLWEANMDLSNLENFGEGPSESKKARLSDGEEDELDLLKGELRDVNLEDENDIEEDDEENSKKQIKLKYKLQGKHYSISNSDVLKLTTVTYDNKTRLLVVGRNDGSFLLYEMPHVNLIQSLSVTETSVSTVALNNTADWIAIGCETQGQLLVWEWQSEIYILKQQGHASKMTTIAYSSDGQYIASGGEDGKLKLWNTQTGFCFVTFNEHTSCVSAVQFANNKKFVISASLDGTVRAFDLARYRNFRTLTSTKPVQFSSLAIDSSCEFVAAGTQSVFEIYLWSMKVGRLLEVLTGHESPVVGLAFHPGLTSTELASVSWDKTLKIWNAIDSNTAHETIALTSDCLAVAYRPDGKEVAVTSLDGQISFFDPKSGKQTGFIEGKKDLTSGKLDTDLISAKKSQEAKAFTCICYSAEGNYVIAGGQSRYVCIYSRKEEILIKKYHVTENRSLDGVDDFINRRKLTEFGNINLIEMRNENQDMIRLPGTKKVDMVSRGFKPEIRVMSLKFSPTNQSWAAATTEGLLVFSLDVGQIFDPYQLDESITPESVKDASAKKIHSEAIMKALKLNESIILRYVIESVPPEEIEICTVSLSEIYIEKLLKFISTILENTNHVEFYLIWIKSLLTKIKTPPTSILLALQKNLCRKQQVLSNICDYTKYTIKFIQKLGETRLSKVQDAEMEVENEVDHLDAVVHVSTAYSNADRTEVDEKVYPPPANPVGIVQCVEHLSPELIDRLSSALTENHPNTYTVTKAMAESIVSLQADVLPISIVRPSIVTAAWQEPYPGWVDNFSGITGIMMEIGRGTIRSIICNDKHLVDIIPVDIVVDSLIVAAWHTATFRRGSVPVYNCTSGSMNPLLWRELGKLTLKHSLTTPSKYLQWYPGFTFTKNRTLHFFRDLIYHVVPAFLVDIILRIQGSKPIMLKLCKRFKMAAKTGEFFALHEWRFQCNNQKSLTEDLCPVDRVVFHTDISKLNWDEYIKIYLLGIRKFVLKDTPDTLPAAMRKLNRLLWFQRFGKLIVVYLIFHLLRFR